MNIRQINNLNFNGRIYAQEIKYENTGKKNTSVSLNTNEVEYIYANGNLQTTVYTKTNEKHILQCNPEKFLIAFNAAKNSKISIFV